ncbi:MAG: permease [Hyphomicrobiales bacterium]|nr:MAG: permease [Hyphomicrobiales bacterium]
MTELALKNNGPVRLATRQLKSVWVLIVLIPLAVLALDLAQFGQVMGIAARAFGGTLPYIVLAVLLIGYLKASGAEAVIARAFSGHQTRMIVLAALFGGLAPFCSCEVIPFIAGLLAVGVPLAPVMAFWLSSPMIDPPTLLITAAALGWPFAVAKAAAAVALGLMGGFVARALLSGPAFADPLRPRDGGGCCSSCGSPFKGRPEWRFWRERDRRSIFRREIIANGLFLLKWLVLAYLLEALLIVYVPASLIGAAIGGEGLWPIILSALIGAPAYLNSYVAPPLVAGLMEQGMSAGAAMAFMIAGGVSSIPAMAAVWALVRPRIFAVYLGLGIGGAIVIGALFGAVNSG